MTSDVIAAKRREWVGSGRTIETSAGTDRLLRKSINMQQVSNLPGARQELSHEHHRGGAFPIGVWYCSSVIYLISALRIKCYIRDKRAIGEQLDLSNIHRVGNGFSMTKKPIANPFALLVGPNRYVLDEQMTSLGVAIAPILLQEARRPGLHDHLYQRM
jgi:hypothetical protein